jgi:hypothetical protein
MPSAVPCLAAGVQRETKAAPTAKDDPAMPMRNAATSSESKLLVEGTTNAANEEKARSAVNTRRPPKRSVKMPIGKRANEPSSTGTATNRAVCDAFRL